MGGGCWTRASFETYAGRKGRAVDASGAIKGDYSAQELFGARYLDPALDPKGVIRECCDNAEHPETVPVILALDVTGSMGKSAVEVAKKLNVIMTQLYGKVKDVEFMIMGIGDLAYDRSPIQASQYESDIRIAEQLDKVYFEFGGGGNKYESYTAAWYFGANHTKLDCLERGKKGLIITMGDERLNPYLPAAELRRATGDNLQADVETKELYQEVIKKFDVYHLTVEHRPLYDKKYIDESFKEVIGAQNYKVVNLDSISETIIKIVEEHAREGGRIEFIDKTPKKGLLAKVAGGIAW